MEKTLTKEQLAAMLNGRRYRDEITEKEEKLAKENNLVVLFGASDDLIELRGAIDEEIGAESVIRLSRKGIPESDCREGDSCPYFATWLQTALKRREVLEIQIFWGGDLYNTYDGSLDENEYEALGKPTWCFGCKNLNGNFATFDIFDEYENDPEFFCRGVVIDLDEIFPQRNYVQAVMEQGGWES